MFNRLIVLLIACAAFTGCATNQRFATDLSSTKITGEKVCEVPQSWKALAVELNTPSLTEAAVVRVRIPAEWIGDALGWFVESEDARSMAHKPRYSWPTLVVDQRTGEKKFFPAVMKNPLVFPQLTVIIPDTVPAGEMLNVYVLSGAYTKALSTDGYLNPLPQGMDCLSLVDAEFLRQFPSKASAIEVNESTVEGKRFFANLRAGFPKPSLQSDGKVYSLSPLALNKQVVGDLRQVTFTERAAKRGMPIVLPLGIGTAVTVGISAAVASEVRYVGPFGERPYTAEEAGIALEKMYKEYKDHARKLGIKEVPLLKKPAFSGRKTGWEIGQEIAPHVRELWKTLDPSGKIE